MPKSFDDDDLFGRKRYAKFLQKLILECDSYHRDDDMEAYSIAIDSPWGTGKSVFLEKFETILSENPKDMIRVLHYNAWKNDFWDNAFDPLASAVFSDELFTDQSGADIAGEVDEKLWDAVKEIAFGLGKKWTDKYIDADHLDKALEKIYETADVVQAKKAKMASPAYTVFSENLKNLKQYFVSFLADNLPNGKLVVVIDELDRCKPMFAVQTLEIVKHIMDVKGLVFVFALDVQQLGAAIKCVYGQETDAIGYLMRFFSYYSRMPEADIFPIVKENLKKLKQSELDDFFFNISNLLQLTARDLETILKTYYLLNKILLSKYDSVCANKLYWLLLCVKYKQPQYFAEVMFSKYFFKETERTPLYYPTFSGWDEAIEKNLKLICDNKLICHSEVAICNRDGKPQGQDFVCENLSVENGTIKLTDNLSTSEYTYLRAGHNISGFLFTEDCKRWNEIRKLTVGQFLHRQLEMFDFIPERPLPDTTLSSYAVIEKPGFFQA